MGVIILDPIQTPYGVVLSNLYATFKGSYTLIKKPDNTYIAKAMLYYHYDRNKKPVFYEEKTVAVDRVALASNIISMLYADLCTSLTSYTVVLENE